MGGFSEEEKEALNKLGIPPYAEAPEWAKMDYFGRHSYESLVKANPDFTREQIYEVCKEVRFDPADSLTAMQQFRASKWKEKAAEMVAALKQKFPSKTEEQIMRALEEKEGNVEECGKVFLEEVRDSVKGIFAKFDKDKSGTISKDELRVIMKALGFNPDNLDKLFETIDTNSDGVIDYIEFVDWAFGANDADNLVEVGSLSNAEAMKVLSGNWKAKGSKESYQLMKSGQCTFVDIKSFGPQG